MSEPTGGTRHQSQSDPHVALTKAQDLFEAGLIEDAAVVLGSERRRALDRGDPATLSEIERLVAGMRAWIQAHGEATELAAFEPLVHVSSAEAAIRKARGKSGRRSGWWILAPPLGLAALGALLGAAIGAAHGPDSPGDSIAYSRGANVVFGAIAYAVVGLVVGLLISIVLGTVWGLRRLMVRRPH